MRALLLVALLAEPPEPAPLPRMIVPVSVITPARATEVDLGLTPQGPRRLPPCHVR